MKNHILLVEDNQQLRKSLRQSLEKYYYVNETTKGQSAIEMASETVPDLIISDITMPDLNGIEFCKIMKARLETTHIPFIILAAKDEPAIKMQGMESGADYYFARPLSIDLLLVTIRNIFERDTKLKQKYSHDYLPISAALVQDKKDRSFFQRLREVIEQNMENPTLDVDFLCRHLYVSRTKLYQKVKLSSDHSVGELIRKLRFKKAIQLLTYEDVAMNEVVDRIGFQSTSNFSRAFKKEYGKPPLQFIQQLKKAN